MPKRLSIVVGAGIAALALTALLIGTALAAGPGPKAGHGVDVGGREIPLAVAAELTELSEEELLAELEGGKTIPVLLEEMGIDLATFHQAVAEARQAAVEEALEEGQITPERAEWMLQHMAQSEGCNGDGPHGHRQSAGWGEPGEGTGPGESHRHGPAGH